MPESGVAAVGGGALGKLGQYLYDRWLALRGLLIGLRIARVSTASAVTGTKPPSSGMSRTWKRSGWCTSFGATTAMELARALKRHWDLEPMVVLVNNDHEVTGLECVTRDRRADVAAAWLWSPVNTVIGTRTARGSHAAVTLCEQLQDMAAKDRRASSPSSRWTPTRPTSI